ncbi:MAG TPA: hypothetical protein VF247_07105 [Candidatus Krumholzibacteria bacterium]
MTPRWPALIIGAAIALHAPFALAQTTPPTKPTPIIEAREYSGPIPQNSISLRVGMFGGAENQEMIEFLDGRVRPPFQVSYEDFSTALAIDVGYIHKPHPRFGLRVNGSASFLEYTSTGDFVPQTGDSLLPQLQYDRKLEVDLFVLEGSGIYFFSDASLQEFQSYLGGGFSLGIPHEVFTEQRTDVETGAAFTDEIPGRPAEASEWSAHAGVHAVGGLLYYFTPRWAVSTEARVQFMEGKFGKLQAYDPESGQYENVNFVIDYAGFYLSLGATYGF